MDRETREYIDQKFSELTKNLKWFGGIFVGVIVVVLGFTTTLSIKTSQELTEATYYSNSHIHSLKATLGVMVELSEITRNAFASSTDSSELKSIMERLNKMEQKAYQNVAPQYRGGKGGMSYSDQIKKYME